MRRAFTLIELLVILAVIGIMTAVSVLNIRSGQGAARTRGAARNLMAQIRRARAMALVTGRPVHLTYLTQEVDGEVTAAVKFDAGAVRRVARPTRVETLAGETVIRENDEGDGDADTDVLASLFATGMEADVAKGIGLKVLKDDETLADGGVASVRRRSSISASAWVDGQRTLEVNQTEETSASESAEDSGRQSAITFRWEADGRTEPHRVYIFNAGSSPDSGLCIRVDAFGAIRTEGEEDE